MVCQFSSDELTWSSKRGLIELQYDGKIQVKLTELLKVARRYSVDLLLFPELSVPAKMIPELLDWTRQNGTIIVAGSHYSHRDGYHYSRCPILVNGEAHFSEKIVPSPLELSPLAEEGLRGGARVVKLTNTTVGNVGVLICADYMDDATSRAVITPDLDILCVPSYQRDSEKYYRRMNIECENSKNGLFILYANFLDPKYGDGKSAVFGLMDRMYSAKLKNAGLTDLTPEKKIYEFDAETDFLIADLDIDNKRPFANRNLDTAPNFVRILTNKQFRSRDLLFTQKLSHDDERYQRIDELFVPPAEYGEISATLATHRIVFIVGDPGIGKTYTAVRLLKDYFLKGFEPIWFSGIDKDEREAQSKLLRDFTPLDNQIVYFEDPFGRTNFERRDSLFQVFTPLLDKIHHSNSLVVISSRLEIFERFTEESLLESEVVSLKRELNIKNPSYPSEKLIEIFEKIGQLVWTEAMLETNGDLVRKAITSGKIKTPLAIRDLVYSGRRAEGQSEMQNMISRRSVETSRVFSYDILASTPSAQLALVTVFFAGLRGKPFLVSLYSKILEEVHRVFPNETFYTFTMAIRSQIGYRVEQIGSSKTSYKISHPGYEEAIATLVSGDLRTETMAKIVLSEIAKVDTKYAFVVINRVIARFQEVSIILLAYLIDNFDRVDDRLLNVLLSQRLISSFYTTRNLEFFRFAERFYSLAEVVSALNAGPEDWGSLSQLLELCVRYKFNSPEDFDKTLLDSINWPSIFERLVSLGVAHTKMANFFQQCWQVNSTSLKVFLNRFGFAQLKRTLVYLDPSNRNILVKTFRAADRDGILERYRQDVEREEGAGASSRYQLLRRILFSEKTFYGRILVDNGAQQAIQKRWVNLLPIGITAVLGKFEGGQVVGIFSPKNKLVAVGVAEYSSEQLQRIRGRYSYEIQNIIEEFHISCAVRSKYMQKFDMRNSPLGWVDSTTVEI